MKIVSTGNAGKCVKAGTRIYGIPRIWAKPDDVDERPANREEIQVPDAALVLE